LVGTDKNGKCSNQVQFHKKLICWNCFFGKAPTNMEFRSGDTEACRKRESWSLRMTDGWCRACTVPRHGRKRLAEVDAWKELFKFYSYFFISSDDKKNISLVPNLKFQHYERDDNVNSFYIISLSFQTEIESTNKKERVFYAIKSV